MVRILASVGQLPLEEKPRTTRRSATLAAKVAVREMTTLAVKAPLVDLIVVPRASVAAAGAGDRRG
jgi:hypothetical protein